ERSNAVAASRADCSRAAIFSCSERSRSATDAVAAAVAACACNNCCSSCPIRCSATARSARTSSSARSFSASCSTLRLSRSSTSPRFADRARRLVSSSERASRREACVRASLDSARPVRRRTSLLSASAATRSVGGGMIQVSVLVSRSSAASCSGTAASSSTGSSAVESRSTSLDVEWCCTFIESPRAIPRAAFADTSVGLQPLCRGRVLILGALPKKNSVRQSLAPSRGVRSRGSQMCEEIHASGHKAVSAPYAALRQCPRSAAQEVLHRFGGGLGRELEQTLPLVGQVDESRLGEQLANPLRGFPQGVFGSQHETRLSHQPQPLPRGVLDYRANGPGAVRAAADPFGEGVCRHL